MKAPLSAGEAQCAKRPWIRAAVGRPRIGHRLRLRLSTLLLLLVIVGLGITVMMEQQRVARLLSALRSARDVNDEAIRVALDQPVNWPTRSNRPRTLEDVLVFLKSSSTTKPDGALWRGGIPIYVDPEALREARVTMASTVASGPVRRTTAKRILQEALDELGLDYLVEGGMLTITSREAAAKRRNRISLP